MLAAESSDFGVTGKLLAETLVVDGTGNVDGSYETFARPTNAECFFTKCTSEI